MPLPYPDADFTGKTVLVTGANTGLGLEAARHFARLNARKVILGCRSPEKGDAAKRDIESTLQQPKGDAVATDPDRIEVWQVDLETFDSVKAFCGRAADLERLDVVVENAGIYSGEFRLAEGYERSVTVNTISTWLMALLLLPKLRATKEAFYGGDAKPDAAAEAAARDGTKSDVPHLVIISSNAHFYGKLKGLDGPSIFEEYKNDRDLLQHYSGSKLLSLLAGREVASRMLLRSKAEEKEEGKTQVVLNFVDPGTCQSELLRNGTSSWLANLMMGAFLPLLGRTAEAGARTYVAAAVAGRESHGKYLEDCKLSTPHEWVESEEGGRVQKRVFAELMEILEKVEPGISKNI